MVNSFEKLTFNIAVWDVDHSNSAAYVLDLDGNNIEVVCFGVNAEAQ